MNIEKYAEIAPQFYKENLPELLKKYLIASKWETLLDCGCGDGDLLWGLKKINKLNGKKIFAIDLSKRRISLVKKIDPKISASVDDAETLSSIKDNSIDFYISTQVIEHVDDRKMIAQIEKKVKKRGTIYISTVFKKWYGWYFYRNNNKWVLDPTHLREYSSDSELLDLFCKEKFNLIENKKVLQWFPISDYLIKKIGLKNRSLYEKNVLMRLIRKIKLPIIGYYDWEIVLEKL